MYENEQKHDINCTFANKDYMYILIKESIKILCIKKWFYKFKGRVCIPSASTFLFG